MFSNNFVIIDVETTGGSPLFHRIMEIGILRVERGEVVQKYKSFVNPQQDIPEFISRMTGITQRQVSRAPDFREIAEDIFPLFEDAVLVAHNSSFDYGFIKKEFERAGLKFNMPSLCTVRLSRVLYPQYKKHNLDALVKRFNFKCKRRHRAFDDAKVLWDFLKLLEKEFEPAVAAKALEMTIKKIPPKMQRQMYKRAVPQIVYEPFEE